MLPQIILLATIGCTFARLQTATATNTNPVITAPPGTIKGSILTTALGRRFYAFRGIRYAWAPRFQPPIPVNKWNGTYDATKDAPSCPQPGIRPIAEECLFLNVYTNTLPEKGKHPKRPVYVHFHSGGFYSVTGSSVWAGPQYFMDQDIVLITLNYRLGSLGFLSTGDHLSPGNYGLKDQVAALHWVKNNIAAFGGDPNLVTISGYSAGATSVSLHLVSPMSQGLFHRAMIMSGSAFGDWNIPTQQFDIAQQQANIVGCPNDTAANIVNCLKTKSAEELGNSLSGFFVFGNNPILIWKPVVEPNVGQERFLIEDPLKVVQCGRFAKVPIVVGITELEFYQGAYGIVQNSTLLREFDKNFNTLAPIVFFYERATERSKYISQELRKFYLGVDPLTNNSLNGLGELFADSITGFSANRVVRLLSKNNPESVYYYLFSYSGRFSHFYIPGTQTPIGAVHHDDLIYLYYIAPIFPKFNTTDPEFAMVRKLTKMHANFALTGKPIPAPTSEFDNVNWQSFTSDNNKYLEIGSKLAMKQNLYKTRYDEWDKLFSLPGCHC